MLSNVRIVLVEPSHPGNIGAAARAMKNMSLNQLYLVTPGKFPHPEASVRASGADEILDAAVVTDDLQAALADCALVFGTSARLRTLKWPQLDPHQAAQRICSACQASTVAIVFGRERTGLTNAELDLCQYLVHIPCNDDFSSLNLAAAVQVLSYEIMSVSQQLSAQASPAVDELPVSQEEMQGFYRHLEQTLIAIEFLDPEQPKKLMRRLRRLFSRAQPVQSEINILRGILSAIDKQRRK